MFAAHTVLTDPMLLAHIAGFQSGLPYALLAFEPVAYEAQAKLYPFLPRPEAIGATVLHHALLTNNTRMAGLLFRVREQPKYAAMARFALDGVLELVCKYGTVQHLEWLHAKRDVFPKWPSRLLCTTLFALEYRDPSHYPEDPATFHGNQKHKAEWLMTHHPEACAQSAVPQSILISDRRHRDFLLKLLAADVVYLKGFARHGGRLVDVSLLELLLKKCPRAITDELVEECAEHGKLDAIQFLHTHESKLGRRCFTQTTMDAAAKGGHLDIVRFLDENRTEGCTSKAMEAAARGRHLEVVKFLRTNCSRRGCTASPLRKVAECDRYDKEDRAIVKYLVKHCPETIEDPTSWWLTPATKYVRSVWASWAASLRDKPVQNLRAAVIRLPNLRTFKKVHEQLHPPGCLLVNHVPTHSLLQLAIEEQKDEIAAYLVENCEHVRASIGLTELRAAASKSRPLNLALLDVLLVNGPSGEQTKRAHNEIILDAAQDSNMALLKALLARGEPCPTDIISVSLKGERFDATKFLIETYPELITREVVYHLAHRGKHEYLFKLHASHPHLWDTVVHQVLCEATSQKHTTWEVLRSLYEKSPSTDALSDYTARSVWREDHDDVLLFMWLVWQDPKLVTSLAAATCRDRLRLYSRLRELVPSLFASLPTSLPWSCQLRCLHQQVETGEITLADVERARSEAKQQASPATSLQRYL